MIITNKITYLVAGYIVSVIQYCSCIYIAYAVRDNSTMAVSKSYTTEFEAFDDIMNKIRDMQGVPLNDR